MPRIDNVSKYIKRHVCGDSGPTVCNGTPIQHLLQPNSSRHDHSRIQLHGYDTFCDSLRYVCHYDVCTWILKDDFVGIHTILLGSCIQGVYRRSKPLFLYVIAVFILANAEFALQLWWYEAVVIRGQFHPQHHERIAGPHHHTITLARTIL